MYYYIRVFTQNGQEQKDEFGPFRTIAEMKVHAHNQGVLMREDGIYPVYDFKGGRPCTNSSTR